MSISFHYLAQHVSTRLIKQLMGNTVKFIEMKRRYRSRLFKPNLALRMKLYPQKTQQSDRELAHQSMLEHQSSDA